jgi:hypothetical protein
MISSILKFGEIAKEQNIFKRMSLISLKSGKETILSSWTWDVDLPLAAGIVEVLLYLACSLLD